MTKTPAPLPADPGRNGGTARTVREARWPWLALVLALLWIALVRLPLVLNAGHHLDSDLAVDGLTLADALEGRWRWHYPGTPYMGIVPVLLSMPQAMLGGLSPATLVSGGVVAYALAVAATFLLAWRSFGRSVALWGLVPLTFASTGVVWLSGRITGGHLLAVAWQAAALALFHATLRRGGTAWTAALGLCCGLGVYLDGMLAFTALAIVATGLAVWLVASDPDRSWGGTLGAFALAFAVGYAPRAIGARVDPYDAYGDQFTTVFHASASPDDPNRQVDWGQARLLLGEHARLLLRDCLPRLLAGRRLPGYQTEPDPATLDGLNARRAPPESVGIVALSATWLTLALAAVAAIALLVNTARCRDTADLAVRIALLLASALVIVGFLINRNIYNSDNYRYLVLLLVPWALGFGVLMRGLAGLGSGGTTAAVLLSVALASLSTVETQGWYARYGWVDGLRPVRVERPDPVLDWLNAHPEVSAIFGDYWDVYRLSFLTGGRVRGVPYPNYPNRFPEWSRDMPAGRPDILVARPDSLGRFYERMALQRGATERFRDRGTTIYHWP